CNSFVTLVLYTVYVNAIKIEREENAVGKRLSFLLILIFLLVIAVGCSDTEIGSGGEAEAETNGEEREADTGEAGGKVKIGVLASLTGALESYGKQTRQGFELGLEYATDGTMEVAGQKLEVVYEDTETKPEVAVQKATKMLEDDGVDFLVGSSSSGDTLAV